MPLLRPLALLGLALPLFLHAAPHGHGHDPDPAPAAASGEGQAPPALFVANRGQWPDAVRFRAALGSGAVFAGTADLTFSVVSTEDLDAAHALRHEAGNDALADFPVRGHAFRLTLVDAAPAAPEGLDRAATRFSYYLGQDPARWASGVPGYRSVRHAGAWPGIDWHTSARGASPKYEFAVAPGADPSLIRLRYEGLEGLRLVGDRLLLETSVGTLVEEAPYAYQRDAAGREVPVPCAFALEGGEIRFRLPEGWDASRELVIDPVLVGSSYSGMSGTSQYGFTATFGPNGDIFGGGEAFGSGFPTSLGAFQTTFGGSVDMAITRFSADASTVVFATYLGGNSSDLPHSLIADPAGDLYVMGTSSSSNYPVTAGAYDGALNGGTDIVVSKLSPDGTALLASTYIGGSGTDGNNGDFNLTPNYGDQHRGEVNFDAAGNVIVASVSASSNFPTTPGALDGTLGGAQDAVVFSMAPDLDALNWSTYLGGTGGDAACALKADAAGLIVVAGGTTSSNFPTTPGAWLTGYSGGTADGFLTRLAADGSAIDASTYVGTNGEDIAYFTEIDEDGFTYAAGNCGTTFPITPGVYNVPNSTQFILKMQPDFSAPIWSTQTGAGTGGSFSPELAPTAFLVDVCGNVYLGGFTEENMPVTPDAIKPAVDFSGDFHFLVLAPDATALLYGTFFGGSGWEHVDGGTSRYSKNGVVYQASCTNSTDFPVTPVSAYSAFGGGWDRVVFAIDFEFAGVDANFAAIGGTISGCVPFTVNFENLSSGSDAYLWDFGTGVPTDTSTLFEPAFTFADTGFYTVTLIASTADTASTCGEADTATLIIEVHDRRIAAALDFEQDCATNTVTFSNLSTPAGSASWDFGDGAGSSAADPSHVYVPGASYTVTLTVTDSTTCNLADVADTTLYAYPELIAAFGLPPEDCAPWSAALDNNTSSPTATFFWDFGDGNTSTAFEPDWTWNPGGSYTVTLVASDSLTCNQTDTATLPITVGVTPVADFSTGTAEPIPGSPVAFFDESVDATSWSWDFGDGSGSALQDPEHAFQIAGSYTVCLTATSADGCSDVACRAIDIAQQVFLPNAFTPNGDGVNDHFAPISQFALNAYRFQIYNRWGELIFDETAPGTGWDGTWKGVDQEGGVYIYVLRAAEIEGVATGTVTLVR